MPIPESTSAEAFEHYIGGTCVRKSRGKAWREIKAWIVTPPRTSETVPLPAVSEPALAWTMSGEAEFQERENNGPWLKHHIKQGSFFLTSGGAPYDCRWRAVSEEPFQSMQVFIQLPLLSRALEEVFGAEAGDARLKDLSAFYDTTLNHIMVQVRDELMRKTSSPLMVQGLAQAIAVHLARNYAEVVSEPRSSSPSLPGFKLRQVTDWMTEHLADEFSLDLLATRVGLSKFHFTRLFKAAAGVSPSQYHLNLRINVACQLLRETKKSVIEVALEVGYNNPSRFAQLFHRETGLTPSEYRRER
jgi:AraC family transcriptional regulator